MYNGITSLAIVKETPYIKAAKNANRKAKFLFFMDEKN
jgi:hypothetical protein